MNDQPIDERIAGALRAQAETITNLPPLRPPPEQRLAPPAGRRRWTAPLLAAAVVAVLVGGTAIGFAVNGGSGHSAPGNPVGQTSSPTTDEPSDAPTPSVSLSDLPSEVTSPVSTPPTSAPPKNGPIVYADGTVGLWPFATTQQVTQWQAAYAANGSQPWHLDADASALRFATDFLGFKEMTTVTSRSGSGADVRIGIGYESPAGNPTAAVVHLRKIGTGSPQGWEALGATSDSIAITSPSAGASYEAGSIQGTITGVDENIHVFLRSAGSGALVLDLCCTPAGGQDSGWGVAPSLAKPLAPGVVAVVAATGGHLQQVERFAVVGVQVG